MEIDFPGIAAFDSFFSRGKLFSCVFAMYSGRRSGYLEGDYIS